MTDIRLYMLQSGTLRCKLHNIKMNEGNGADYEIPVPFFLITHPKGHTVIDGGNAIEVATDPRGYWGKICDVYWPILGRDKGCVDQVKALGFDPADVRYVVHSPLHLDHTGAFGRFPNARQVVQRAEYQYAFAPDWFAAGGYIRKDFDRQGVKIDFLYGVADDHCDLYGDGTLTTVFSPGHSPGHQSFLVRLPRSGPVLLTGDAVRPLGGKIASRLSHLGHRHRPVRPKAAESGGADGRVDRHRSRSGRLAGPAPGTGLLRLTKQVRKTGLLPKNGLNVRNMRNGKSQ